MNIIDYVEEEILVLREEGYPDDYLNDVRAAAIAILQEEIGERENGNSESN